MNTDVARLLAQVCQQCGIRPQLVIPNVNATNATTQVSLPNARSQASAQCRSSTTRIAPAPTPSSSTSVPSSQGSHMTNAKCGNVDVPIKVINPKCKREAKTYILHSICVGNITTLKRLKEIILEHLGKSVVSLRLGFDVGYIVNGNRICFSQSDDVKSEIVKKGFALWCEGLDI